MKDETKTDPGGQTDNASGVTDDINTSKPEPKKSSVDYNSFTKALDEKKRAQGQLSDALTELEQFRDADLKRKGKTDELLSAKEKRIAELEATIENTDKTYTWKTITDNIKSEAIKNGCTKPEKLIRLMSDDDLKLLSENIGENFEINNDALGKIIEKNKKENYFLFEENKKISANGNPKFNSTDDGKVDFSKMSLDELKAMHAKMGANK